MLRLLTPFLLASLLAPAHALDQPEAATSRSAKQGSLATPAKRFAVTAANPLAVDAGVEMLKAGGSAVDAVVAVQAVLGLVEPQSSGIAGGAFLMHWDDQEKTRIQLTGVCECHDLCLRPLDSERQRNREEAPLQARTRLRCCRFAART